MAEQGGNAKFRHKFRVFLRQFRAMPAIVRRLDGNRAKKSLFAA